MGQPRLRTVKRLFAVSGNQCAFPECDIPLVDETSGKVTGRICHILGKGVGGPRYDVSQSETERHAFDNLVLMCPVHHDVIDADIDRFSVHDLRKMKMRHESLSATRTNAIDVADEVARRLLANSVAANVTDGSVVTSINQSGGQTAHSITNIHRQVFLNKGYSAERLTVDTYAIDRSQCAYEEHRLDPSRPFWPEQADPMTVCYIPGGRVRLYGKEFSSRAKADAYGATLRQKYNHYSFYLPLPLPRFRVGRRGGEGTGL